jgi:hypothetical protein
MTHRDNREISLSDIASGVDKVRWRGNRRFTACCPAHNDRNPSFNASDVDGKILVKCFAGCTQDEVINALMDRGLWPSPSRDQLQSGKNTPNKEDIWRHQMLLATELARADQGYSHTEAERKQIENSVQFLRRYGYG